MKQLFFLFTLLAVSEGAALFGQGGPTPEQDAIRKVIEEETLAIQLCDYTRWAGYWWHEPSAYFSITNPDQHIGLRGWEEISAWGKNITANCLPADQHTRKTEYRFAINGNMAFVTFLEDQGNESTRVLEKRAGQWKLLRMGVVYTTGYAAKEQVKKLHRLAGSWTADMATLKIDPAPKGWAWLNFHFENTPTESGIRLTHQRHWENDAGLSGKYTRRMEVAAVSGSEESGLFVAHHTPDGWSGVLHGTAKLGADGSLTGLPRKPNSDKLDETSRLTLKPNGRLYLEVEGYGDDGKVIFGFSVEMVKN